MAISTIQSIDIVSLSIALCGVVEFTSTNSVRLSKGATLAEDPGQFTPTTTSNFTSLPTIA